MPAAIAPLKTFTEVGVREEPPTAASGLPQGTMSDLLALLPLLMLATLGVGGVLYPRAGRWIASSVTGASIGFFVWWSLGAAWPALLGACAAWSFTLVGTFLWFPFLGRSSVRRRETFDAGEGGYAPEGAANHR